MIKHKLNPIVLHGSKHWTLRDLTGMNESITKHIHGSYCKSSGDIKIQALLCHCSEAVVDVRLLISSPSRGIDLSLGFEFETADGERETEREGKKRGEREEREVHSRETYCPRVKGSDKV